MGTNKSKPKEEYSVEREEKLDVLLKKHNDYVKRRPLICETMKQLMEVDDVINLIMDYCRCKNIPLEPHEARNSQLHSINVNKYWPNSVEFLDSLNALNPFIRFYLMALLSFDPDAVTASNVKQFEIEEKDIILNLEVENDKKYLHDAHTCLIACNFFNVPLILLSTVYMQRNAGDDKTEAIEQILLFVPKSYVLTKERDEVTIFLCYGDGKAEIKILRKYIGVTFDGNKIINKMCKCEIDELEKLLHPEHVYGFDINKLAKLIDNHYGRVYCINGSKMVRLDSNDSAAHIKFHDQFIWHESIY